MEKSIENWPIAKLRDMYSQIDFPEYQREPNLWSATEKQRLIDSIIRRFDIAPLYFYQHETGSFDCVDGRQRIGTIMSFLGSDQDDGSDFRFRILNEIYDEEEPNFLFFEGKTFVDIEKLTEQSDDPEAQKAAKHFVQILLNYQLNVVILSDSNRSEEFNLQFTRLNLGAIINSGEKLHAMVGELRNVCFGPLGKHPFLKETDIPTRRYAQEQVAAQVLAQIFSREESGSYSRTRHVDLQRQFKMKSTLDDHQRQTVGQVSNLFGRLEEAFRDYNVLRNRAITVSTVLLAWEREFATQEEANEIAEFINVFVHRVNWQAKKGVLADPEYHYLTNFRRNITQASAESSSVDARAQTLRQEFAQWQQENALSGDAAWQRRNPDIDLDQECGL